MPAEKATIAARPRKQRAENAAMRRRQIIEATIRSVVRNGLAGTTLATVAAEAGLSQGVAVFYFENKQTLLAEALRYQYEIHEQAWKSAVEQAGDDPIERILAMVRADFDPAVCNPESLVVWHAFWGEASARPVFGQISEQFDNARAAAMREACLEAMARSGRTGEAVEIALSVDALTDGLWLRLYLSSDAMDRGEALVITARFLAAAFPEHAQRILSGLGAGAGGRGR